MNANLIESESKDTLRRVKSFEVKKLFGLYDHRVELFLKDRVTIIHGPNGVGKTTILRLVNAVFTQDFAFLFITPFESLNFELDDGAILNFSKSTIQGASKLRSGLPSEVLNVEFDDSTSMFSGIFEVHSDQLGFEDWASQFEAGTPWIHKLSGDKWVDQRTDTVFSAFELWNSYSSETGDRQIPGMSALIPDQFQEIVSSVKTYLVEAQRLVRFNAPSRKRWAHNGGASVTSAVVHDAQDLASRIKDSFTNYGRVSQKLDQTFPQRLFERGVHVLSNQEITSSIKSLESDRQRLLDAGVLDSALPYPFDVSKIDQADQAQLAAMSLYVSDSREKLDVLVKIVTRVEPLIASINGKFKNKIIQLDKERGLIARISGGDELRPDQLSSGEQHQIVLLYNLLFRLKPNALVLIDEPELSLHIEWQRKILPELLEIAYKTGIDALVATHSPSVVGDRDDLMIALDADRDDLLV